MGCYLYIPFLFLLHHYLHPIFPIPTNLKEWTVQKGKDMVSLLPPSPQSLVIEWDWESEMMEERIETHHQRPRGERSGFFIHTLSLSISILCCRNSSPLYIIHPMSGEAGWRHITSLLPTSSLRSGQETGSGGRRRKEWHERKRKEITREGKGC